jgi:hypothetical protein
MIYFVAGAAVLALLVWAGRGGLRSFNGGGVRVTAGVLSTLALMAAGFLALRGGWIPGLILAALSLGGAFAARRTATPPPRVDVSLAEARSILGVGPSASDEEIQAAYTRLMRMAHPDKGGTSGLAAQLNAARDRLISRR